MIFNYVGATVDSVVQMIGRIGQDEQDLFVRQFFSVLFEEGLFLLPVLQRPIREFVASRRLHRVSVPPVPGHKNEGQENELPQEVMHKSK